MSKEKYFSIPYISNSTLTWFKVSPKYCWKRMKLEIQEEEKSYSYLGTQIHMSLLEPEEFEKNYTYLDFKTPTSKQQLEFCEDYVKFISMFTHEYSLREAYMLNYITPKTEVAILKAAQSLYDQNKEYIEYLRKKGDYREILSKSKQELITTIIQSIKSHKKASSLLIGESIDSEFFTSTEKENSEIEIHNEYPICWDFPLEFQGNYLKCKSLLDRLVVDHNRKVITIVDLKTTATLGNTETQIQVRDYYRQLAFYRLAVQHCELFPKNYKIEAYVVSVTTQDPVECFVFKLTEEEYLKQVKEISSLMLEISWHWFTNQWEHTRNYYEGDGTENHENE